MPAYKKCSVCGQLYTAYGIEDLTETEVEGDPSTEDDILNSDEIEFVTFKLDSNHPGTVPTANALQFLTISERMDIQDENDILDLCPTCKAAIESAINELMPQENNG